MPSTNYRATTAPEEARGTFRFVGERGIPLDIVLDRLKDKGFMVGWPRERTIRRLREVVGDVYGPEWARERHKRMLAPVGHLHDAVG